MGHLGDGVPIVVARVVDVGRRDAAAAAWASAASFSAWARKRAATNPPPPVAPVDTGDGADVLVGVSSAFATACATRPPPPLVGVTDGRRAPPLLTGGVPAAVPVVATVFSGVFGEACLLPPAPTAAAFLTSGESWSAADAQRPILSACDGAVLVTDPRPVVAVAVVSLCVTTTLSVIATWEIWETQRRTQ
jgi:hypothetical protein